MAKEDYELSIEDIARLGSAAIARAREENHRHGLPNVYSEDGIIYFELPDGTITTEIPDRIKDPTE